MMTQNVHFLFVIFDYGFFPQINYYKKCTFVCQKYYYQNVELDGSKNKKLKRFFVVVVVGWNDVTMSSE